MELILTDKFLKVSCLVYVLTCFLPTRQCWCTWVMDFGMKINSSWRVGQCVFSWMWATAPADQYHPSSDSPPALACYAGAREHWDKAILFLSMQLGWVFGVEGVGMFFSIHILRGWRERISVESKWRAVGPCAVLDE